MEDIFIFLIGLSSGVSAVYGQSSNVSYVLKFKEPVNTTVLRHRSFVCKPPGDSGVYEAEAVELMDLTTGAAEAKTFIRTNNDGAEFRNLVIACACSFLGGVVIVIPVSVSCVRPRARKKTDICPNTEKNRELHSTEIVYENNGVQETQQKGTESRTPPKPPRRKNKNK